MGATPVYRPPAGLRTALDDFRDYVNQEFRLRLQSYNELHEFSVKRMNDFWMSVWRFTRIKASVHPTKAVDESIPIDQFPHFFQDARMNFAENMLRGEDDHLAIIGLNEQNMNSPDRYTWQQLRRLVEEYSDALRSSGVKPGDVIALVGGNNVRSLALLFASASVSGMFASFATDIGSKALKDRISQLRPKFLFGEASYFYNGKRHDSSQKLVDCFTTVSGLEHSELIIIGELKQSQCKWTPFNEFLARGTGRSFTFDQVLFNNPLLVMFSSGTTGTPKGIVHSHGGLTLNGIKEHLLHNNFGPNDIHFHFSGIGWTLWNISIGALLCKTPMVLYDGSPFYPSAEKFLQTVLGLGVTGFGAGPRYYAELQKQNIIPKSYAQKVHSLLSTGAVLTPALASWIAEAFGPICQIGFSGGTELCGSFMHGTRSLPAYPGQVAAKALGMDIDTFSANGQPLPDGESGELVCKKPFPNMPVMFWNDPGKKRFHSSYFEGFPHVWTHGDFVRVDPETKGIYVLGRSDGVLNPSGVRFGSSEIYSILAMPQFVSSIVDAVVVGQQRTTPPYSDSTESVLLFIKCTPQATSKALKPKPELEAKIVKEITQNVSRRHVPAHIFEVSEVPYNVNGKKLEIQVKAIVNGGSEALGKLKITEEERKVLQDFVRFHDLERLLKDTDGIPKARL